MSRESRTDLAKVSARMDQTKAILKTWLRQKSETLDGQQAIERIESQITALMHAVSLVGDVEQLVVCEFARYGLQILMLEIWTDLEADDDN